MKFIVNSTTLLKHLSNIDGVVVAKPIIPILNNFLFDIKDGELKISSTDLETTMTTSIKVEAKEELNIAIPSRTTIDLLKTLPDQPLAFSVNLEKGAIEIKYDTGRFKLTAQRGDEFPKNPVVEDGKKFTIPAKVLHKAITKTVFATSNDELRLNLTGVYVQLTASDITFVATDANRLVRYKRTDVTPGVEETFILPKKALNLLKSSLPNDDTEVTIEFNRSNAFFTFNDVSLICRLIDEKYPDYNAVIPKENPNVLQIDKNEFSVAVKRVSITSNKTTHQIRLKLAGSELTISAEDIDFENEAQEKLVCQYTGEDLEIGFNSKYLSEMISAVDSNEIKLEMSQPNRAGVLTPIVGDDGEDVLMLVMPMMLNSY
ncbi:MAG: DNA polymerase III subunit beta [Bacteroidia bacterium]|jgi:DNA polymerase-3 subunit beta|nr:DNA polymerase III subunit beta [Bacteroidia bacterium]